MQQQTFRVQFAIVIEAYKLKLSDEGWQFTDFRR